jgi:hypothetical protein
MEFKGPGGKRRGSGSQDSVGLAMKRRREDPHEVRLPVVVPARALRAVPAFGTLERVDDALGDALLIEHYQQGGASVVHVYPDAIAPTASADQRRRFAKLWCVQWARARAHAH